MAVEKHKESHVFSIQTPTDVCLKTGFKNTYKSLCRVEMWTLYVVVIA